MPQTFDQFAAAVDAEVQRRTGASLYDLADCNLADWHDDGYTVAQAASKAISFDQGEDDD